ncbi:MAG: radical SAM family heme chaperone HemW [Gammaproteobacteria bacterium]|nr:radical SAM family heme chaperone HemW [Gammaproteobacteria bacterium]
MSLLAQGIPLSLYIHFPWCVEKCPYCDFNSHQLAIPIDEHNYVNNLLADLEQDLSAIWGRNVETIFIGGGTPSLFSAKAINELLSGVRSRLMLRPDLEITLESNPGTADAENYQGYQKAGINRLSIGVQSFNDKYLKKLGRIHNAQQAVEAFHHARTAGFKRINIDLMFALPEQSLNEAMSDLEAAIALDPEHLSWYQLTIEANTAFAANPPLLPDNDLVWEIQCKGKQFLEKAGYQQYEISAWSKTGEQCQHNLNYWQFGDYLGIGPGAHGKITDFSSEEIHRTRRKKQPRHWLTPDSKTLAEKFPIKKEDISLEFMMNILRLNEGVPACLFTQRTGLLLSDISASLNQAREQGLIETKTDTICATEKGLNYLNNLLEIFI